MKLAKVYKTTEKPLHFPHDDQTDSNNTVNSTENTLTVINALVRQATFQQWLTVIWLEPEPVVLRTACGAWFQIE